MEAAIIIMIEWKEGKALKGYNNRTVNHGLD